MYYSIPSIIILWKKRSYYCYLEVKRTYMLRSSTVRKLNELKSIHPDLNAYVSTIVDLAIAHYYEHIINEGGAQ